MVWSRRAGFRILKPNSDTSSEGHRIYEKAHVEYVKQGGNPALAPGGKCFLGEDVLIDFQNMKENDRVPIRRVN